FLDTIKDSLELHPRSLSLYDDCSHSHHLRVKGRDALPLDQSLNLDIPAPGELYMGVSTHKFS
ncbi:hypothetical protein ACFL1S_02955, partial [Pseudomonadota bacterium]